MNMLVEIKRIFRKENLMQTEEKSNESKRESMLLKHRWRKRN